MSHKSCLGPEFDKKTQLPKIPFTFYSDLTFRNRTSNSTLELCVEVDKDERLNAAVDQGQRVGRKEGGRGVQLGHSRHHEDHAERADADHEEGSDGNHLDRYFHVEPGKG